MNLEHIIDPAEALQLCGMQFSGRSLGPPFELGQYREKKQNDELIVALNAGNLQKPAWCLAVLDYDLFSASYSLGQWRRGVQTHATNRCRRPDFRMRSAL